METKTIIEKINSLYVSYRQKFLILNKNGKYSCVPKENSKKKIKLTDTFLKGHLDKTFTIGVFAGTMFTKFICFDVDVKNEQLAKWTAQAVVNSLMEIGISDKYINISLSGSKGYHIEIFFTDLVEIKAIKQLYMLVTNYGNLLNLDFGEVELRPTDSQGVKIPLGKHFGSGNMCWYCDTFSLKPIEDYSHILSIQQMDSQEFLEILNYVDGMVNITEKEAEEFEEIVKRHKPLKSYQQNIDEEVTIEAIEELIETGLIRTGTRHNSLLKIAKYNKFISMSEMENKMFLIEWMEKQNKLNYTTKWEDVLEDIDWIVKWVYENKCSLVVRKKDIVITSAEVEELIKIKGKNDRLVLYSLLVHSKRYENNTGMFYMSYKQMEEVTGLTRMTLINIIKRLENSNIIKVIRDISGTKKLLRDTNRYIITLLCIISYIPENGNSFQVCEKNCKNCLNACLCALYTDDELKDKLPRKQYENIRNYRGYCEKQAN